MESAFARPVDDVLANFDVNQTSGLSDAQVDELRKKHGRNCTLTSWPPRDSPATGLDCNLTFVQLFQMNPRLLCGSLSSNNSKISLLLFYWVPPPSPSSWPSLTKKRVGAPSLIL